MTKPKKQKGRCEKNEAEKKMSKLQSSRAAELGQAGHGVRWRVGSFGHGEAAGPDRCPGLQMCRVFHADGGPRAGAGGLEPGVGHCKLAIAGRVGVLGWGCPKGPMFHNLVQC